MPTISISALELAISVQLSTLCAAAAVVLLIALTAPHPIIKMDLPVFYVQINVPLVSIQHPARHV